MDNTTNINLQAQEIWDMRYQDFQFFIEDKNSPVSKFMLDNIPTDPGSCFEIGCFPGRYMALLGQLGWELNGIDLTPNLPLMQNWFEMNGWKAGTFKNAAIENYKEVRQYDVVFSSGFIEHFINFREIIAMHTPFVKKGGKLIITAPNFTGLQGILHRFFDIDNYRLHYIKSMRLNPWKQVLIKNGFQIDAIGPLGTFDFWIDSGQKHGTFKTKLQRHFMKRLHYLKRIIRFKSTYISPYLGISATKL